MKMYTSIFKFLLLALLSFLVLPAMTDSMINNKNYNYLGDENAPNTLVEYASLSCVHCANFHNKELPAIKSQLIDKGKLKYIYKDFPLDLPAMLAAMVSNCYSGLQYFEILNSLFRNQKKWVTNSDNKKQLYSIKIFKIFLYCVKLIFKNRGFYNVIKINFVSKNISITSNYVSVNKRM